MSEYLKALCLDEMCERVDADPDVKVAKRRVRAHMEEAHGLRLVKVEDEKPKRARGK